MAPSDPFGLLGQVLDGQFRVDAMVGEGGFSIVYRGTHVGLSEPIAVKCLKLPVALGSALVESFVRRFRDESRLHYKLSQGNLHIVRAIASGTVIAPSTSALVPYTVLEWLEGHSLAHEFHERRARGLRGRPLPEVVRLLDTAIDAVAHAHAQGVVHRDLNPGNLFLAQTPSGVRLKVLDFGVAKVLADSALAMGPTARTVGNVRMFAPAYGAPEQFDEGLGAVGPWSDVYALALVCLEALTDRTVMDGSHVGEFALKALDPNARPTPRALGVAVGDEVESAMARAVAISPHDRPRDAGEFWGSLKHAIRVDEKSGRAPHAARPRPSDAPPPATQRIPPQVPEGTSPAVEVTRPKTDPPPGHRAHTGTVRMSTSPRTATEALAATPAPMPTTTVRMLTPTPPPPQVGVLDAIPPPPPAPVFSSPPPAASSGSAPPPIVYPRRSLADVDTRPSGSRALVVVLFACIALVAVVGAILLSRSHRAPAPPSVPTSTGG